MRPTAFAAEEADHWYDAADVQAAYRQGLTEPVPEQAKDEKRAAIAAMFDEEDG